MLSILSCLLIAFFTTYLLTPVIIRIAEEKKLFDLPDFRKLHIAPIASLGGVAIFCGLTLACLICVPFGSAAEFQYLVAAAIIIFFLGLKDDILLIAPMKKFAGQILAAGVLIVKGGLVITNLHGFMGIYEINQVIGGIITLFTFLVVINAFNLIDGVDGLAGSLGLLAAFVFGMYFMTAGQTAYAILSFSLTGSMVAFLFFNFQPAKIFMGDCGSLLLGLLCSVLVIKFIEVAPSNAILPLSSAPAIGFSVLMIPLLDTLRVFGLRIMKGKSPFKPDRNHIHHILLDKGLSHRDVTLVLFCTNALIVVGVYMMRDLGNNWLMLLMVTGYFGGLKLFNLLTSPRMESIRRQEPQIRTHTFKLKPIKMDYLEKQAVSE